MRAMGSSSLTPRRAARLGVPALTLIAFLSSVTRAWSQPPAPESAIVQAPLTAQAPPATLPAGTPAATAAPTPTLALEPAQPPPPLALDREAEHVPTSGRPVPIYRKDWFWAGLGVVILTMAVIFVSAASAGTDTPNTKLGNMRAF
jgi:hypothetical protein